AIARSIIHEPQLVLADELTGNLDSKSGLDVMNALRDLNAQHGVTVVMVTHDPFAASFCRRILFIRDGRQWGEIRQGSNRQSFMQQILDNLSVMSGGGSDVPAARSSQYSWPRAALLRVLPEQHFQRNAVLHVRPVRFSPGRDQRLHLRW